LILENELVFTLLKMFLVMLDIRFFDIYHFDV